MLHRLIRHHRTRVAILAALLPYAMAAMFVNFFHVHEPGDALRLCADHSVVSFEAPPSDTGQPFQPTDPCPACIWLKVSYRLEASISISPAFHPLAAEIPAPEVRAPWSPSRQPVSLRGPPSLAV